PPTLAIAPRPSCHKSKSPTSYEVLLRITLSISYTGYIQYIRLVWVILLYWHLFHPHKSNMEVI
ncbi:MAG: hypothetical protein WBL88_15865, partial [Nitrososphaeraceae archaeon]